MMFGLGLLLAFAKEFMIIFRAKGQILSKKQTFCQTSRKGTSFSKGMEEKRPGSC